MKNKVIPKYSKEKQKSLCGIFSRNRIPKYDSIIRKPKTNFILLFNIFFIFLIIYNIQEITPIQKISTISD